MITGREMMVLVAARTFGLFICTVVITIMWILHKKRHTTIIKYKPKGSEEIKKYATWEKRLDVLCVIGVIVAWLVLGIPCIRDIPVILTGNLTEVNGIVTSASMSGENSNSMRRIHVKDTQTEKEYSFQYYGEGIDLGKTVKARFLPHTEFGYIYDRE